MTNDLASDSVIQHLVAWATPRDAVRAVLLTSTRTMPGVTVDPFSDYDVILAVRDVHPFFEDRRWLEDFGTVLVVYRDPIHANPGGDSFAYITQYEDNLLKIDFTVIEAGWLRHVAQASTLPPDLDVGYRVLLDKDDLTRGLQPPTHTAYRPAPPTEAAYLELIEVFFHEVTYVAKHLWRGDLLPAKFGLDQMMKQKKLHTLLTWQIGIDTGWSQKTGSLGKGLQKQVAPEIWSALAATYVGAEITENWDAMIRTIDLFRRVAVAVGEHLGYAYPHALDQRVQVYLDHVKTLLDQKSAPRS